MTWLTAIPKWIAVLFGVAACVAIIGIAGPNVYHHKPVRWDAVAAVGTFAAAAFALAAALVNAEQAGWARLTLGVTALIEFDREFRGSDYREKRKTACEMLRDNKPIDETDKVLEDVVDFFETIGLLTRRRALDQEIVWSYFFYWLSRLLTAGRWIRSTSTIAVPHEV